MIVKLVDMFHQKAIILHSQVENPKAPLVLWLTDKIPGSQGRVLFYADPYLSIDNAFCIYQLQLGSTDKPSGSKERTLAKRREQN
jgi:hypothetical protein